jgi:hypothetical protein
MRPGPASERKKKIRAAGFRQQLGAFSDGGKFVQDLIAEDERVVARLLVSGVHTGFHPRMPEPTGRCSSWTGAVTPGEAVLVMAQGLLMYFAGAAVCTFLELVSQRCPGATLIFDTIPVWAATRTGHRQKGYRLPPQPWGIGRRGAQALSGRFPLITDVPIVAPPRGRGLGWGILYPAATRFLVARGLLPMTVALSTSLSGEARVRAAWSDAAGGHFEA